MKKIFFYIHNFAFLSYMILFTSLFFLRPMIIGIFDKKKFKCHSFLKIWFFSILKIAGVKLSIVGRENLKDKENEIYVFAFNYQSILDISVIAMSVPHQLRWLAKKELFSIPFLGWRLRTVAIPLNRNKKDKKDKKIDTIKLTEDILRSQSSVVIFPEGTRREKGTGAALIAIKCKKTIVPFAIVNSSDIIPKGKITVVPGTVKVITNKPICTDNLTEEQKDELINQVKEVIEASIKRYLE